MSILEKNQKAFSAQSEGFSSDGQTYAKLEEVDWMLQELPLTEQSRALDIATGTGELARGLAARVASVVGLDATPAMLEKGRNFIRESGIENVSFQQGQVEDLPFEDERFDVVTCRYAFHHFADPKPVISEMARVCRRDGHILIVDIVTRDEATATEANYYEWRCDPSHTRCCGFDEIQKLYRLSGIDVFSAKNEIIEENVLDWLNFSLTRKPDREAVIRALEEELAGGEQTGLAPFMRDGSLYFRQREAVIVGRKR